MFSKKFLIIQILLILSALFIWFGYLRGPTTPALNILGKVQDFQLTDSNGASITLFDLKGKVWVADFFFTTCSGICPMMGAHMHRLQEVFKPYRDVRLVSFSVNPENDTPEALKAYGQKLRANPDQWMFLTGSREELTKLAVESFKVGDIKEPVFHSSYFTLVDKEGRIRGYYDSSEPKNMDQIIKDLKQLLKG